MKLVLSTNPAFNPTSKTLDFSLINNFDIKRLFAVINITKNIIIYSIANQNLKYTSYSNGILTLNFDTSSQSSTDILQCIYDYQNLPIGDGFNQARLTDKYALSTGNALKKFRDNFFIGAPDLTVWDQTWTNQGGSFVKRGGNSSGSGYLLISLDPLTEGSEYDLISKETFKYPTKVFSAISASQRISGQEFEVSLVGVDSNLNLDNDVAIADMAISGNISITSSVATINFATNHPYKGGDRIILKNNQDTRLNVGPVSVTVISPTQITIPLSLANATYTASGSCEWADQSKRARNVGGLLFESITATTASIFTRRNGSSVRTTPVSVSTTAATQANTSAYSEAFNSANFNELYYNMQELMLSARASDSQSAAAGAYRYTNTIPDEENYYKIRIRAKNLNNIVKPIAARIVSISKTGTTTATVTTDVGHNLSINSWIQIYGVRDQTNFPNLTTVTQVSSIISSTQFTIIIGTASTTSSTGGAISLSNGNLGLPGALGVSIQSIARTNGIYFLTLNTTTAVPLPGEYWQIHGCDATSMGLYDGAYKVQRVNGAVVELEKINDTASDFSSINCGGAFFKRTDIRIHFIQAIEYTRHLVELFNQNGTSDANRALAVMPVSGSIISTVSSVTSSNLGIPVIVADIASAALTTTTTTAAIAPTYGTSYTVNIPVTAVTGTTPTLDVSIEESDDTGTNWYKVYDFPRITTTGMYRSPQLRLRGNRIRYVQTVTGTTPSFTRSINRLQSSSPGDKFIQLVDRTLVPNTASSNSVAIYSEGIQDFNFSVRCSAQTTAATIDFQISDDNSNWVTVAGGSLTTIVGTARVSISNIQSRFVRAFVTSAGTGITLGEIIIKGVGK